MHNSHGPEQNDVVSLSTPNVEFARERQRYWDEFAGESERWAPGRRYYRRRITEIYQALIPPGLRVLDLGCGDGDLLAALNPSVGVGIDLSPLRLEKARQAHPKLTFLVADAYSFSLGQTFDVILCSDLVNELWDVQSTLHAISLHSHARTRLVLNVYNNLWAGLRRTAEWLGIVKPQLDQNWFTVEDLSNLLYVSNFEPILASGEILFPFYLPALSSALNRYLVKLWPFRHFGITNVLVARPNPELFPKPDVVVSVIVAARNEEGNIRNIFDRVPGMGLGTELIFVEGGSTDNTFARVQEEIEARPGCGARLARQHGKGKGDAVRLGFSLATGGVLMILDADLTVPPEDLPRFYEAWRSGKGDFINGVRLVYPMHRNAMRFFNLIGNKFFSLAFSWLLSQTLKDTLCGTKVLSRQDYDLIARNRSYFGDFDPFGDFDLIFGAARLNLKIVDIPVRYTERTYGATNINRWSHGWLLLRMVLFAMRRIRFQ